MGNGKGNPEYWVAEIKPGKVLYEIEGVSKDLACESFRLASAKLPVATTFVTRYTDTWEVSMKTSELRSRNPAELSQELGNLLKDHFSLRMRKATQQLTNTNQLRSVRRDIARIRTLLTEKSKEIK